MPPPPVSSDQSIGPYRLIRPLGEGGMGLVFLAHDPDLHRNVALKILRQTDDPDRILAARVKRFLREARSAARLNDPHVVTIYAVGTHAQRPFLAMEYLPNGSLADALRNGPLPWQAAARAMRDAARALAAAHAAGVIHRDVKPANLLRAADGRTKLTDFGLARASLETPDADLTFPGAFVGSPSYASPEQITGSATLDHRSDLYSLAATAFALLTAQPPFIDDDPAEVMRLHLKSPFPNPRKLLPKSAGACIPNDFLRILTRASEKNPQHRHPSAADIAADLDALLSDSPPHPDSPPASPTTSRANDLVTEAETTAAAARRNADSTTQLAALRRLVTLYTQLGRPADASRAFREALVLHVKLNAPNAN